jgi:hypothetical protein
MAGSPPLRSGGVFDPGALPFENGPLYGRGLFIYTGRRFRFSRGPPRKWRTLWPGAPRFVFRVDIVEQTRGLFRDKCETAQIQTVRGYAFALDLTPNLIRFWWFVSVAVLFRVVCAGFLIFPVFRFCVFVLGFVMCTGQKYPANFPS